MCSIVLLYAVQCSVILCSSVQYNDPKCRLRPLDAVLCSVHRTQEWAKCLQYNVPQARLTNFPTDTPSRVVLTIYWLIKVTYDDPTNVIHFMILSPYFISHNCREAIIVTAK